MTVKKKNLRHQLKATLHDQFKKGTGKSRHAEKQRTGTHAVTDMIFSRNSLETHMKGIENFSAWVKENHSEVKNLSQINETVMRDYANGLKEEGKSRKTIETYLMSINRIQIDKGYWEEPYTLKKLDVKMEYNKNGNNGRSTPEQIEKDRQAIEKHEALYTFGRAFGLRRSELIGNRNNERHTYASNKSLYENGEGKLYCVSIGKGGKIRKTEVLKLYEQEIRETYKEDIRKLPSYLDVEGNRYSPDTAKRFMKEEFKGAERLFDTIDRSCRIHVPCRQYYAMEKLDEIKQQNLYECDKMVTINGIKMTEQQGQFISEQLGHHRLDVLKNYIGRQVEFA